jgi:hypothetical protein
VIFDTFSPQALRDAIEIEMQSNDNPKIASIIALKRLKEDPEYYSKRYRILNKAKGQQRSNHKYIRRESDGKGGWNYFYKEEERKKEGQKLEENKDKSNQSGNAKLYYNYRRNDKELDEEIIFASDNPEESRHYGNILRIMKPTDKTLNGVNSELLNLTKEFFKEQNIDIPSDDKIEKELNPSRIVSSGGAWDNVEFINFLYEKNFFDKHDGIITNDGAIFFESNKNNTVGIKKLEEGEEISEKQIKEKYKDKKTSQTETPEFKKWFGDSKVVDGKGKPLVVYHGTVRTFSEFDKDMQGMANDSGYYGPGFYFSSSSEEAWDYAKNRGGSPNIIPAYISIQKPFFSDFRTHESARKTRDRAKEIGLEFTMGGFFKNPEVLFQNGFDGIVAWRGDRENVEIIAFSPTQIKSAIGNRGTFDLKEADMTKAGERAGHKYYKRVPKPTGKGYYYFYTQQQFKDYKSSGILPEEKEGKFNLLTAIKNLFGFSDERQAKEKVKEDYKANAISERFSITLESWASHLSEYFLHKDKWTAFFNKEKPAEKKATHKKPGEKETSAKKEKPKSLIKLAVMKAIHGLYGKIEIDSHQRQEILNSIAEGEMILKSGKKISGEKMSNEELAAVQVSINNSKRKIGIPITQSIVQEGKTLPSHLQEIADKGYTVTDVTPVGYGPGESIGVPSAESIPKNGIFAESDEAQYWNANGQVYRLPKGKIIMDVSGNPSGGRWESSLQNFLHYNQDENGVHKVKYIDREKAPDNFETMPESKPGEKTGPQTGKTVEEKTKIIVEAIKEATPENRVESEAVIENLSKEPWAITFDEYRLSVFEYRNNYIIDKLKERIKSRESMLKRTKSGEPGYNITASHLENDKRTLTNYIEGKIDENFRLNPSWDYLQKIYDKFEDKNSAEAKSLKRKLTIRENKAKAEHERLIKNAIKDNKVIPANVLKEYPEIQNNEAKTMTVPDINYKPVQYEKEIYLGAEEKEGNKRTVKINDYSKISPKDVYLANEETILNAPRPSYIPEMDFESFAGRTGRNQNFDVVRIGPNKYIIVDKRYPVARTTPTTRSEFDERSAYTFFEGKEVDEATRKAYSENAVGKRNYFEMSAETLAATWDYYRKLYAAKEIQKNEEQQNREEKRYNERKDKMLAEGKQWPYAPFKRSKIRPKKVNVDATTMSYSQAFMIQDFTGLKAPVSEFTGATKMNMDIFENYQLMLKELEYKINDLRLQKKYDDESNTFKKGEDTSYGDVGTKNTLLESKGVLIKRQNGTEIDDQDTTKIGMLLDDIYSIFGDRSGMSKKYGLKISYAGEKRMHASKAIGCFIDRYKCIAISNTGIEGRGFTFAHEFAHYMDSYLGSKDDYHFSSDKDGSIANKVASNFRRSMNLKINPETRKAVGADYYNRTCECFARAMEQYYAIKQGTEKELYEKAKIVNEYVEHNKFVVKIMPLCEQFLKENDILLKAIIKSSNKIFFFRRK